VRVVGAVDEFHNSATTIPLCAFVSHDFFANGRCWSRPFSS
jgi:hypothetical protein